MSEPLISIIIPVLNGSNFLDRCFSTLENQVYSNLEVIFIDNGSKDNSRNIIQKYCSQKEQSYLLDCKKPGPGTARNVGVKFAKGEYLSFLDVDDELEPDKHLVLMHGFEQYPDVQMVVGKTIKKYSDGREIRMDLGKLTEGVNNPPVSGILWMQQFQHHPHISAMLIRKEVIKKVNYFPENLFYGEDISLSVKIAIEYPILIIDEIISIYYRHAQSSISKENCNISTTERYFQFYEKFALPYFMEKKEREPFKQAYYLSEKIAFKLIMKLIIVEGNLKFKNTLKNFQQNGLMLKKGVMLILFSVLPFNVANYLYHKLT